MKLYLLFIPAVILFTCTYNNSKNLDSEVTNTKTLKGKEIIQLPSDSITLPISNCIKYFQQEGSNYLAYLSENSINIYDLSNETLDVKIHLDKEGPDGVGIIKGFQIVSEDLILVFPYEPVFYLINFSGKVKQSINYSKDTLGTYYGFATTGTKFNSHPFIRNNNIYLPIQPQGLWSQMSERELFDQPKYLIVDTANNQIYRSKLSYPNDYFEDGRKDMVHSVIYDNERVVLSMVGSPYIYISDDLISYTSKVFAGTKIETKKIEPLITNDITGYIKHAITNTSYLSIIYDPYRNVYYRLAALAYDLTAQENTNFLLKYPPRQAIIILNKDFQRIGEVLLEKERYVFNNSFVGQDGFYISTNHPNNPEFDQDFISFQRFELSDL